MGISGLLQFIKDASEPVNVKKYRGQAVAVDTYCWLHKGAFSCAEKLAKGEPTDQYVWYCMKFVDMLLNFGVKPILVFDGRNLPSKREVEKSRRERREVNLQKGKQLLRDGKVSEARECFHRCVNITPAMAHNLIKTARARGVDCVVAPYEADAQLAFLSKSGLAEAVITEDSDLLAFGCRKVILKMDKQGNGLEIDQKNLGRVKSLGNVFTEEKFRHMCILSGCDYLPSLHGIGLGKACKLLRLAKDPDILKVIRKMGQYLKMDLVVPDSYLEGFVRANNTFLYQLVFDPRCRRVLPLNPYPESVRPQELSYAGQHLGDEKGLQMALGNLDLNTLEAIDDFSPDAPQTKPLKLRSRSWSDSPSSLRCDGSSIWSRGRSTAPPTAASPPPSPPAEPRASTRGQHRVVSVAPLRLLGKRPRQDSPLSDQNMFLQYSTSEQKRPRPDPPPSASVRPRSPRNRFATLLQRRNEDGRAQGAATCSRFFSSSSSAPQPSLTSAPPPPLPRRSVSPEAADSEGPEAPSVDTPSPSPPASPQEPAKNTTPSSPPSENTTPPPPASPQQPTEDTTPSSVSPGEPAAAVASPGGSSRGLKLFHWSSSASAESQCSSGLSALRRFRFKKENVQTEPGPRPHSPLLPSSAEEQPDSPPSQDSAYFSQSQPSAPPRSTSPPSDSEGALSSCQHRFINFDKAEISLVEKKPGAPSIKAGLSRPNAAQTQKSRALGPARASGLKRKSSLTKPSLNNENHPGGQTTLSGLWKSFSFSRESPKLQRKEPLSPHKDNPIVIS
uniref:Exonuclease 1 n=1 Tax=Neogobius melanostomus TaxID=47308 RepID=A0A8C6UG78_9GOBI